MLSKESGRISKEHSFYSDCVHDLSNRSDGDTGKKREKPTPDAARLLSNLDRFSEKWQHISNRGRLLEILFCENLSTS